MKNMRHPTYFILLIIGLLGASACGPKMSQDNYIKLMSDLGCGLVTENSPQSEAIYKKYGATQADIQQFRQKTKRDTMMQVSQDIAKRVAACHGAPVP